MGPGGLGRLSETGPPGGSWLACEFELLLGSSPPGLEGGAPGLPPEGPLGPAAPAAPAALAAPVAPVAPVIPGGPGGPKRASGRPPPGVREDAGSTPGCASSLVSVSTIGVPVKTVRSGSVISALLASILRRMSSKLGTFFITWPEPSRIRIPPAVMRGLSRFTVLGARLAGRRARLVYRSKRLTLNGKDLSA